MIAAPVNVVIGADIAFPEAKDPGAPELADPFRKAGARGRVKHGSGSRDVLRLGKGERGRQAATRWR